MKSLLHSGARDDDVRRRAEALLGLPWPRIEAEWRRRIAALGAAAASGVDAERSP